MKEFTTEEVREMLENGDKLNLIDVREVDEVAKGMIPSAKNIPLGEVDDRLGEFDKSKPYIIICRSGGRSGRATEFLEDAGFNVTNMAGGMLKWEGATE